MLTKALFASVAVVSLSAVGCGQPTHGGQTSLQTVQWQTYTSPDGRVSLEYPSHLKLKVRERKEADDPQVALFMADEQDSLGVTLILRVSDESLPDYCESMLDACLDSGTKAITKRESISRAGARGFRQEFREGYGWSAQEFIAITLEAHPAYVHFTCGYSVSNKQDFRPICERIAASLTLKP
jgi:hypothetical protein